MGPWSPFPGETRSFLERKTPARRRSGAEGRAVRAGTAHHHAAALVVRDGDVAAQHLRAVTHEFHPHAVAGVSFIETPTVVLDGEGQRAFCRGEVDADLRDPAVADRVGEGLLGDPV